MARTPEDWLLQTEYDLETAEAMLKSGRYIYVIFFCHLAIEKGLKGIYQKRVQNIPPKIHNLLYFVEKLDLKVPDTINAFVEDLNNASIPTRYPESFQRIYKDFTLQRAEETLRKSKESVEWIKSEFAK